MKPNGIFTDAFTQADAAAIRVSEWRTRLVRLAAGSLPNIAEDSFLGRELKAAAVIAVMAELEAMLREMLISVGTQINGAKVALKDLKPSLRPLVVHNEFESLITLRDRSKVWVKRMGLTALDEASQVAILPERISGSPQPPLDGRTIQSRHLALVWQVLDLADPVPEPTGRVVASLKKMTQIRNDVAHRNVGIEEVFRQAGRSAAEIEQHMDWLELLIVHIGYKWDEYINEEGYLR